MIILFLFWMLIIAVMVLLAALGYISWYTVMMTIWIPILFIVVTALFIFIMAVVGWIMFYTFFVLLI